MELLKFVTSDSKRSEEKLQFGSPFGNEMFKQAIWHQVSHALQQIIRSSNKHSCHIRSTRSVRVLFPVQRFDCRVP